MSKRTLATKKVEEMPALDPDIVGPEATLKTLETMANHYKSERDAIEARMVEQLTADNTSMQEGSAADFYRKARDEMEQKYLQAISTAKRFAEKAAGLQVALNTTQPK